MEKLLNYYLGIELRQGQALWECERRTLESGLLPGVMMSREEGDSSVRDACVRSILKLSDDTELTERGRFTLSWRWP